MALAAAVDTNSRADAVIADAAALAAATTASNTFTADDVAMATLAHEV